MALVEEFDSGMASECDKSPEKKQIECDCIDDEVIILSHFCTNFIRVWPNEYLIDDLIE